MIIIHQNRLNGKGALLLKRAEHTRWLSRLLLPTVILLIIIGGVMLGHTFNRYNMLSLERQDMRLEETAQALDANMATQLNNLQESLRYVIARRGFVEAEKQWQQTGAAADLLYRMQENLITGDPLVHAMLAVKGNEIILSTDGNVGYYFPAGMDSDLQPCFSGDGTMYLALFEPGGYLRYAALLSMSEWFADLADIYGSENTRLLLLGNQRRLLLHEWMGQQHVTSVEELTEHNCDQQAVRYMMESQVTGKRLTVSYDLIYPNDDFLHEMRMTTIPLEECANGYFVVGLTSDYDEIIRPMHAAAWGILLSGALLMLGALLLLAMAIRLVRQGRRRDRELERLALLNEETQKLLEKTKELAHHQRLETIGTLTASIAHEFNNLLTPIMGYSILTLEGLPEGCEDLADNMTEIYEASRKAKDIISRLNELSRKREAATFAPLSLGSIMNKAMQAASPAQPPRVMSRIIKGEEELLVSGNETQLSQLLLNLILNAYHAMEGTGGTLTLSLTAEDNEAVLRVQDEGVGISQEALPHIFEPFFTTKESGRGTGLGLAIVQRVVQSHHGQIEVESTSERGTTFVLRLPLAKEPENDNS